MQDLPTTAAAHHRQRRTALLMLTLVCVFWGTTFPLMKEVFGLMQRHTPSSNWLAIPVVFLTFRFIYATLLMPLILPATRGQVHPKPTHKSLLVSCLILGFVFTGSFYLQVFGLAQTSPSISAFLTSLFVVFTPLVLLVFWKKRPEKIALMATLPALVGAGLIAWNADTDLQGLLTDPGVYLSLLGAVGFAVHIVFTDYATRRANPWTLSFGMMVVSCVLAGATVPFLMPVGDAFDLMLGMAADWEILWRISIMTIFATTFAVYAWNRYQKVLGPTRAAVLYTLEPVFATFFALGMGLEEVRWGLFVGGPLIIAANIACELASQRHQQRQTKRFTEAPSQAKVYAPSDPAPLALPAAQD